jgi:ADP-ribose pyrophosphatase YjhB (NUDIX family)
VSANSEERREAREYPSAPIVGIAAVVLRGEDVLLIRRGREPMLGAWSLPGGALELGETTAEGIVREVFEETGLRVLPVEMIATLDRIVRDEAGCVRYHYVLVEWLCRSEDKSEDPVCGDDAADARWVGRMQVFSSEYNLEASTLNVIELALKLAETREQ